MRLGLFFTRGVSLETWCETGLFDREKLIYEKHLQSGTCSRIYWFTYGKKDRMLKQDLVSMKRLHERIEVIPMPGIFDSWFGCIIYSIILPILHWNTIRKLDVLKTNQMDGSWCALFAKWITGARLLVRTGYTASLLKERLKQSILKIHFFKIIEKIVYSFSDYNLVSNIFDECYVREKYKVSPEKISVMHNYIETGIFYPAGQDRTSDRLLYVGRLTKIKNIEILIRSLEGMNLGLDIYGEGELIADLKALAESLAVDVEFKGIVSNSIMPEIYNRYKYFVITSINEGMPKSLLEALACGLVCIGTDVTGINEVISDGVNGYLCSGTDVQSIRGRLHEVIGLEASQVSENAVETIKTNFALEHVASFEGNILKKLKTGGA